MQRLFDDIIEIDELIRSHRRTISIMIDRDAKIIVRAPLNLSEKYIKDFINEKKKWINEKRREVLEQKKKRKKRKFVSGEKFLFLGEEYPLYFEKNPKQQFSFSMENKKFIIDEGFKEYAEVLFIQWYKLAAKGIIQEKLNAISGAVGIKYNSMKITSAKKRWGSCSGKKNLNFSYRLILAPEFVVNYVIIHELAHTIEMNHSKKFWKIVESIYPDYKKAEEWLKKNVYTLDF